MWFGKTISIPDIKPLCRSAVPKLCPLATTVPHQEIPAFLDASETAREVQAVAGDSKRWLVALPGIEPGFED